MHWDQRIANYTRETKFPKSLFTAEDGRVVGTWIMGNVARQAATLAQATKRLAESDEWP